MADYVYNERKRLLFFALPWTFTVYHINDEVLTVDTGFFNKEENDCLLYRITDVILKESFWERIVKIGTITCFTSDVTDPHLELKHIKHAKEIKNYILKESEAARIKRRSINMQDISHHNDDGHMEML